MKRGIRFETRHKLRQKEELDSKPTKRENKRSRKK
jgi:hypothetical protein